ncbi:MAG: hypothetical protein KDG50_03265 [Chromatiales bacterium]|nr:hypothetical protein [Chromatiales bacterium]
MITDPHLQYAREAVDLLVEEKTAELEEISHALDLQLQQAEADEKIAEIEADSSAGLSRKLLTGGMLLAAYILFMEWWDKK